MANDQRLLIVEDDAGARDALAQILRDEGFDVASVADGRQALGLVEAHCFGTVIADIQMPEMDGLELLRELRKREPCPSVIVMSARGAEAAEQQAMALGAAAFLRKPIDIDELMLRLREACA